jgi:hypothetical protein
MGGSQMTPPFHSEQKSPGSSAKKAPKEYKCRQKEKEPRLQRQKLVLLPKINADLIVWAVLGEAFLISTYIAAALLWPGVVLWLAGMVGL